MTQQERAWKVFIHNREAVVEALRRGECDGILPAAKSFLDGFARFLENAKLLSLFNAFPDPRERRSIAPFFFCHTLVYRPLFNLSRLADIGETLFRSPYILRLLGFNARQVREGFYQGEGQKPFDVEALADFFALATEEDFFAYQLLWFQALYQAFPQVFQKGLWVMDAVYFSTPNGALGLPKGEYKVCLLGVWQDGEVWPLLWLFAEANNHDLPLGKKILQEAVRVLGTGVIRHLLVDPAFLDGEWWTQL